MENEKWGTTVKTIQIEEKRQLSIPEKSEAESRLEDHSGEPGAASLFQPDRLMKNLAFSCGLMLVILALRTANQPASQTVFSALEAGVNTEWEESIGKLSFVTSLLPEEIQQVWAETESTVVFAPVQGEIIHAWTRQEPYIEMLGNSSDVRAVADGEIMSIAHGEDEERIVRIRHRDGTEALYGNLSACFHEVGEMVYTGDPFARLLEGKPLACDYRRNGRSVEVTDHFFDTEDIQ